MGKMVFNGTRADCVIALCYNTDSFPETSKNI